MADNGVLIADGLGCMNAINLAKANRFVGFYQMSYVDDTINADGVKHPIYRNYLNIIHILQYFHPTCFLIALLPLVQQLNLFGQPAHA